MKKLGLFIIITLCTCQLFAAVRFSSSKTPGKKEYVMYMDSYDWGPAVEYVVLNAGKSVKEDEVKIEDFDNSVVVLASQNADSNLAIKKGKRVITKAFPCNENGSEAKSESKYIRVEFEIGPDVEFSDMFNNNLLLAQYCEILGFRIKNGELGISATRMAAVVNPTVAKFHYSVVQNEQTQMQYASWEPAEKKEGTPVFIWLHGISEGGTNIYKALMGIKSSNLITDEIQQYFDDGMCVVVPQCPTAWLETTTIDQFGYRVWEPIDIEGTIQDLASPIAGFLNVIIPAQGVVPERVPTATYSYYTPILKKLIDDYLEANPYVDRNKIYIGGCSAGGYMTMNMLLEYPDFFAAAVPVCEVYVDSKITDEGIKKLANVPMWFVHSETDNVVRPEKHDLITFERLQEAGAKDIHYTMFPGIFDKTGLLNDEDGNPYEYSGHFCWIETLNNTPEENGVKLFQWLSRQKK